MQLTHGLNVRDVVGHLFAAECLSKRELEQVQAKCDNAGLISASEDLMSNVSQPLQGLVSENVSLIN